MHGKVCTETHILPKPHPHPPPPGTRRGGWASVNGELTWQITIKRVKLIESQGRTIWYYSRSSEIRKTFWFLDETAVRFGHTNEGRRAAQPSEERGYPIYFREYKAYQGKMKDLHTRGMEGGYSEERTCKKKRRMGLQRSPHRHFGKWELRAGRYECTIEVGVNNRRLEPESQGQGVWG